MQMPIHMSTGKHKFQQVFCEILGFSSTVAPRITDGNLSLFRQHTCERMLALLLHINSKKTFSVLSLQARKGLPSYVNFTLDCPWNNTQRAQLIMSTQHLAVGRQITLNSMNTSNFDPLPGKLKMEEKCSMCTHSVSGTKNGMCNCLHCKEPYKKKCLCLF